jgi:hypothetical protein
MKEVKKKIWTLTICKTTDPWTTITFLETFLHVTKRHKANVKTDEELNDI